MKKVISECGYMLKLIKLNVNTDEFKEEFNAIKHGDYDNFVKLIGESIPVMIVGDSSKKTKPKQPKNITEIDFDFGKLCASGPSIKKFIEKIHKRYGTVTDRDIDDETYENAIIFEISVRMHATNNEIYEHDLFNVINKLCKLKTIQKDEIVILHGGRKFINDIKHCNEIEYKRKFETWKEGVLAFKKAEEICIKHGFEI